jgi:hypothetical protein
MNDDAQLYARMLDEARRRPGQAVYPAAIPGYRNHPGPVLPAAPARIPPARPARSPRPLVTVHGVMGRALVNLAQEAARELTRILTPPAPRVERGCPHGHPDCCHWGLTSAQAVRYHARVAGRQVAWQRTAARRALRRAVTVTTAVVLAAVAAAVLAGVTR